MSAYLTIIPADGGRGDLPRMLTESDHRRSGALVAAGMTAYVIHAAFGYSAKELKTAVLRPLA
jgi:hypothetical protein